MTIGLLFCGPLATDIACVLLGLLSIFVCYHIQQRQSIRFLLASLFCVPVSKLAATSPDGAYLAFVSGRSLHVRTILRGELVANICSDQPLKALHWSPDSKCIAVVDEAGLLRVWNVTTERMLFRSVVLLASGPSVSWSPDSRLLGIVGADQSVHVWNMVEQKYAYRSLYASDLKEGYGLLFYETCSMTWTPDSRYLAIGTSDGVLRVWDASDNSLSTWHEKDRNRVTALAFSETGPYLLLGDVTGKVSALHVVEGKTAFWSQWQTDRPIEAVYWGRGECVNDAFAKDITGSWRHWRDQEIFASLHTTH